MKNNKRHLNMQHVLGTLIAAALTLAACHGSESYNQSLKAIEKPNLKAEVIPIDAEHSQTVAINDNGIVAGFYYDEHSNSVCANSEGIYPCRKSYLYNLNTKELTQIEPLNNDQEIVIIDINNQGLFIAETFRHVNDGNNHFTVTSKMALCKIDGKVPKCSLHSDFINGDVVFREINNKNEIVGVMYTGQDSFAKATIFSADPVTLTISIKKAFLDSKINDFTHAFGINDHGILVGTSFSFAQPMNRPFSINYAGNDLIIIEDFYSIRDHMFLNKINNNGLVVGSKRDRPAVWQRPTRDEDWKAGEFLFTEEYAGEAFNLNDQGQIVGTAMRFDGEAEPFAFLYNAASKNHVNLSELFKESFSNISQANDINEKGQIAADASMNNQFLSVVIGLATSDW